jgi:hypothetical protein
MFEDDKEAGIDWSKEWRNAVNKSQIEEGNISSQDTEKNERRVAALLEKLDSTTQLIRLGQGNLAAGEIEKLEAQVSALSTLARQVLPIYSETTYQESLEKRRQEMERLIPLLPDMATDAAYNQEQLAQLRKSVTILMEYDTSEHQKDNGMEELRYYWFKTLDTMVDLSKTLKLSFHKREVFELLEKLGTVHITQDGKKVPLLEVKGIAGKSLAEIKKDILP